MNHIPILITFLMFVLTACFPATEQIPSAVVVIPTTPPTTTSLPTESSAPTPVETSQPTPSPTPEFGIPLTITQMAVRPTASFTPAATLIPSPGETLDGHEVVLRIHNLDKMTGRAGQLTRWLAWGSTVFTVAPDGSYWLGDVTNGDFRLVHLSPTGEILDTIPLQASMMMDIAASEEYVWVLEYGDMNVIVIQIRLADRVETCFLPPQKYQLDLGMGEIATSETGELVLVRSEGVFFTRLIEQEDQLFLQDLPGYSEAGNLYRLSTNSGPVMVNNQPVEVAGIEQHNYMTLLGAAPDGSFYVAGMGVHSEDNAVQHFSAEGQLLGIARPPKNALYFYAEDYDNLAVGPDGAVYALVSLSNQDAVIVRLNFTSQLPTLPTPTPYVEWTPMPILRPAWETPPASATNQKIAENVLITFLARLDEHQYAEAGELYEGGMEGFEPLCAEYPDLCTHLASVQEDPAQFWQVACSNLLACFSIGQIVEVEIISDTEFHFWVELVWEDGYRYVAHACCGGNPAITPFEWIFPFTVREVNGQFLIIDPPPPLE